MTVSIIPELKDFDNIDFESLDALLNDDKYPLHQRFRALFTLKNLPATAQSISIIAKGFKDPSALFKHEIGYVLGQMKSDLAIPYLKAVLEDLKEDPMVRHEAAEALGAIGNGEQSLEILRKFAEREGEVQAVAETCVLAIRKIEYESEKKEEEIAENSGFSSIDPAPPLETSPSVQELKELLINGKKPLFERYQAMFSLRNIGTEEAVLALAEGFKDQKSCLFRHEIAYVFGQLQHEAAVPSLISVLENKTEEAMVRHEAAEALGSIATPAVLEVLKKFANDPERVVRESCLVALDMYEYEQSGEFQYADGLQKLEKEQQQQH